MSHRNDGGPAFPVPLGSDEIYSGDPDGMSLRDFFAAKAMQGMIATAGGPCLFGLDGAESDSAKAAFRIADAMLAAREGVPAADPVRDELLEALIDLLGDYPDVNRGGICDGCGRDYLNSEGDIPEMCLSDDCPRNGARAAIAKAGGAS